MTSEPREAFVWVWLPGAEHPVVAGRLDAMGDVVPSPTAAATWNATSGSPCICRSCHCSAGGSCHWSGRSPAVWPMQVQMPGTAGDPQHRIGRGTEDTAELSRLTYLLDSGSDRIGALDFQTSSTEYVPRSRGEAQLWELASLAKSAQKVEEGIPLSPALDQALLHGSSVSGARPKVLLRGGGRRLIAKFSSTADTFAVVKAEFVGMELARRAGIEAAKVELTKDVLLVERSTDCRPGAAARRSRL